MAFSCLRTVTRAVRQSSSLAGSWTYNFAATGSLSKYERVTYSTGQVHSQTQREPSVNQLLKGYAFCKQDGNILNCLSDVLQQAHEEGLLHELKSDHRFAYHLGNIAKEAEYLSTGLLIAFLKVVRRYDVESEEFISSLALALTKRMPDLDFFTTSKIGRYLSRLNCARELAEPFLSRSTEQCFGVFSGEEQFVDPNVICKHLYTLHYNKQWPGNMKSGHFQEYVVANSSRFNLHSLGKVIFIMMERRELSRETLHAVAEAASKILNTGIPVRSRIHEWESEYHLTLSQLLRVFAKYHFYHEGFCSAVTRLVLGPEDSVLLHPRLLSTIAWSFAVVRYYDAMLMDHIACHSIRRLDQFNSPDLGNLVYGFGQLNHSHPELLQGVVENILQDPLKLKEPVLCWTVVWSAMVMDICPERLLKIVLTDDFVRHSQKRIDFKPILLLPLSIAINVEHPGLSLATCTPSTSVLSPRAWGTCLAGFHGVGDQFMRVATQERIMFHSNAVHSAFSSNVTRALKTVVGGTHYFNEEPLSLSGYSMDFEVLLNSRNEPIAIPIQWKYRRVHTLLKSVGIGDIPHNRKFRDSSLLSQLQQIELNLDSEIEDEEEATLLSSTYEKGELYQIASDWGPRFTDTAEPVARRVAIEADGSFHFAQNCTHKMGKTTLKHRQLKALGWEVVSIPQHEWEHLKTGDDHITYLGKKLDINKAL